MRQTTYALLRQEIRAHMEDVRVDQRREDRSVKESMTQWRLGHTSKAIKGSKARIQGKDSNKARMTVHLQREFNRKGARTR